ncbi:phenylacetate--CoA ligase family protein [Neptuniibacter sp. QD72_48]|uniref:phenylacetate--CoA ligase family protein n=1 Tax=unclassified Neptuniibacter TaxID=2630693 RepID=UPI0039F648A8
MPLDLIRQGAPGLKWPVIPVPDSALHMALQFQLEQSQWLSTAELENLQWSQAQELINYAAQAVPLYRERIPKSLLDKKLTRNLWSEIPILTRQDLIDAGDKQKSVKPLAGHDRLNKIQSSGSTGMPITAYGTQTTGLFWQAFTAREHIWHQRDFSGKLAAIRPVGGGLRPGECSKSPHWGGAISKIFETGPAVLLSSRTDIAAQVKWLVEENPAYLLSLPSNICELAKYCKRHEIKFSDLKQIRTMGEILTDETIELCKEVWNVSVVDMYSAQEIGYIALQCPEHGSYHIQSEGVLVEILDKDNQPCSEGEIGRVVVTTLLNFGAPLIRYELGDYAEVGSACCCGRGLPVLNKILGRKRNMMKTPDGRVFWPSFPSRDWESEFIKQLQVEQTAIDKLKIRIAISEPLTDSEEQRLERYFSTRFDYPFIIEFDYVERIQRSKGGKYEDFVSCLT